jgi:hypothetical protein
LPDLKKKKKLEEQQQQQGEAGPPSSTPEDASRAADTPAGPGSRGGQPKEGTPAPVPASNGKQSGVQKAKRRKLATSQSGLAVSSNGDAAAMAALLNGHAGVEPASGTGEKQHGKKQKGGERREASNASGVAVHAAGKGVEADGRGGVSGSAASGSGSGDVRQPAAKKKTKEKRTQHNIKSGS